MAEEERAETGTGWPDRTPREAAAPAPAETDPEFDEGTAEVVPAVEQEPAQQPEPDASQRRRSRVSAAGAIIGLLLGLLGFALVVQLKSTSGGSQLETSRDEDLVRILSDLNAREERLRAEISNMEITRSQLQSGAQGREAALAEARRRADQLGILAGTLPARGEGLTLLLVPGKDKPIRASTILDAVEELRGAGAEAMQISGGGGAAVRIVASTYFVDGPDGLVVDATSLPTPYLITVIGPAQTMQTALTIPGGVRDAVERDGGNVIPDEPGVVRVDALHEGGAAQWARPVQ